MSDPLPFADRPSLRSWLDAHYATAPELLVLGHKVATLRPSVTWEDCVIEALRVGWIDGVRRSAGPEAWVQRLCPRRPRSTWSARNVALAEGLIAAGEMTAAGLAQVEAARADGRWAAAYAGPRDMTIPADFLLALESRPRARATFATLNRQNLYAIYHRLHTAKRPETRARRMEALLATLDAGERFH
jgi:uncharacterized protein YdeI (YjbR/CyaY-like superfamily)